MGRKVASCLSFLLFFRRVHGSNLISCLSSCSQAFVFLLQNHMLDD